MLNQLQYVVAEITSRCNFKCVHCGSDCGSVVNKDELDINGWKDCISQFADMGAERIFFSGGEPTIKPGIESLIFHTARSGLKYGIITNGFFLKDSLKKSLVKYKPFAVGVSLDGLNETHNLIRMNGQSWHRALQTISWLQEAGIQVCVVTTVNKANYQELPKLARLINLAGIDSWQIQLIMPSGRAGREWKCLRIDEMIFKETCRNIQIFRRRYPKVNIQAADCFGLAPAGSIRSNDWPGCGAGISSMGIDAFGNVIPCLSLRSDLRCGNARDKPIKKIWEESPGFDFNRKFSVKNAAGECRVCGFLKDCRGGCASLSFSYHNHFHDVPFCFTRSFEIKRERR